MAPKMAEIKSAILAKLYALYEETIAKSPGPKSVASEPLDSKPNPGVAMIAACTASEPDSMSFSSLFVATAGCLIDKIPTRRSSACVVR
jgi:hypothetical protein